MKKLNILGYSYTLYTEVPMSDIPTDSPEDGGKNVGLTNLDTKEMWVASDMDKDQKDSVLIHEIIEAINYHLELNLQHNQIMALEVGLHQVFQDSGVELSPLLEESYLHDRTTGELNGTVLFKTESVA